MRGAWVVLVCGAAFVAAARFCDAAEFRSGQEVVIKADETIADDLYCFGEHITVDGTVEGDVVAFGSQITINGKVLGDVMAAGQTVVLLGESEGARIAGQVLKLGEKAKLDGDLLGAGFSLECVRGSRIDGDAIYAGYQALFSGEILHDLRAGVANCRLAGPVEGDVFLEVGSDKNAPPASTFGPPPPVPMPNVRGGLSLSETAQIKGDLTYQAPQEADVASEAKVEGEIKYQRPTPKADKGGAPARPTLVSKALVRARHIVCVLLVGLVVLALMPRATEAWTENIRQRPGASLLTGIGGIIAFIALLFVGVIVIIAGALLFNAATLSELVPMVIFGGMVGYAAMIVGVWIIASFLSEALTGIALGKVAFRENTLATRLLALLVGAVLVGLVLSLPYVGWFIGWGVAILGLGSVCLWLIGQAPPQSFAIAPAAKPVPATTL